MSKAAGIVGVVLGTIILIVGLFLLFVVFATNMHMMFAGQYLFLGVVIMAIGGYLIYKGKGRIDKARGKLRCQDIYGIENLTEERF